MELNMKAKQITFEQIREILKNKDILFSDIAAACDVTRSHVTLIAKGESTSHRVAKVLCNALDKPIHEVFGDKYDNPVSVGKHRVSRKQQVVDALKANMPVPSNKIVA
jgi:transcriptional regulator with XRE-family HTH domain